MVSKEVSNLVFKVSQVQKAVYEFKQEMFKSRY